MTVKGDLFTVMITLPLKEPPKEPEPVPETLTEQEQAILETAINVDYLVCMKELEI